MNWNSGLHMPTYVMYVCIINLYKHIFIEIERESLRELRASTLIAILTLSIETFCYALSIFLFFFSDVAKQTLRIGLSFCFCFLIDVCICFKHHNHTK